LVFLFYFLSFSSFSFSLFFFSCTIFSEYQGTQATRWFPRRNFLSPTPRA
jgi:hypothetical protein